MNDNLVIKIIGAVVFFALIVVSIVLHEIGHFLPGKLFKVKVLQFFVGFGKTLWKKQKGETEYGFKLLPLGGYVRLLGMYPPYREGKNTWLKRMADSARAAEWEMIADEDVATNRLYFQKPLWQRLVIMFCGVAMNLLLAFGLFLGVNLAYGQYVPSSQITTVWDCVDPAAVQCDPTPAAAMGLLVSDTVVAVNGAEYQQWADLLAAIRANLDNPIQLSVIRDGVRLELPQVPGMVITVADPDDANQTIEVGFLGVNTGYERVKVGPIGTVEQTWTMTTESVKAIVKLPVTAYQVLVDMITGAPRDPNGPISVFGAAAIAGDIAASDTPWAARVAYSVILLASINLFVGLLNLVPLLPFDGGHIAAGIFEAIRKGVAKIRHKPDPGPADTAKLLPLTYVVTILLILMGVVLIIADIVSPMSIF